MNFPCRIIFLCLLPLLGCHARTVQTPGITEGGLRDDAKVAHSFQSVDNAAERFERHAIAGLPRLSEEVNELLDIVILENVGYVCGFSRELKIPVWTCYRLGDVVLEYERSGEWRSDPRLPKLDLDENSYRGSGKQRGHMAPAYGMMTRYGSIAMIESFYMANACPMEARLNQGVWATAENHVARNNARWANAETEVWVICGPLWQKDLSRLPSGVAIPKSFFKVLVRDPRNNKFDSEQAQSLAFLFPAEGAKEHQTLEDFIVSIDEIEMSGIDLMPLLHPELEVRLEGVRAEKTWVKATWESP
jgi:endonuclease G